MVIMMTIIMMLGKQNSEVNICLLVSSQVHLIFQAMEKIKPLTKLSRLQISNLFGS